MGYYYTLTFYLAHKWETLIYPYRFYLRKSFPFSKV